LKQLLSTVSQQLKWYLGLQNYLHFPKHFLAPIRNARLPRNNASDDRCDTKKSDWALSAISKISPKPRYMAGASYSMPKRAMFSSNSMGTSAPSRLSSQVPFGAANGAGRRVTSSFSPAMAVWAPQVLSRDGLGHAAVAQIPGQRARLQRLFFSQADSTTKSRAITSLAPIQTTAGWTARLAASSERTTDLSAADPRQMYQTSRKTRLDSQAVSGYPSPSMNESLASTKPATVADSGAKPGGSTMSTIHIDGSALGRWAVQYLERALGRPTTGMTGVDPRASLPRYRVSPF